jgi:hypothetical protein
VVALVVGVGVVGALGAQLVGALGGAAQVVGVGVGVVAVAGGGKMNAAILRTGFDRSWAWSRSRAGSQSWAWAGSRSQSRSWARSGEG